MLKVVFVLGCLLCLTLAYSQDDATSDRVERSPLGQRSHRGRGHFYGKDCLPWTNETFLKLLEILLQTAATTTTTVATTATAATTPVAAT